MERDQIIMSFSSPPSADDIEVIAKSALESLPEELLEFCENMAIRVEDFPDEAIQQELELEDPYDFSPVPWRQPDCAGRHQKNRQ
jgi:predicted Zn-dependent protease with MMP-like domain